MISSITVARCIICYLIGSLPFSVIISKYLLKKDIRNIGSKNIGTSNAYRAHGLFFASLIGILDFLKGYIAVKFILSNNIGMLLVCCGQIFPIWLAFKGGKGMATYFGALSVFDLHLTLLIVMMWMLLTKITYLPFFATLIASGASLFVGINNWYKIAIIILIIIRHKENILNFIKSNTKQ